jgi:hypothetical protein
MLLRDRLLHIRTNRVRIATSASSDYYVAKNGNDSWSGTLAAPNGGGTDGPLLTISAAQAKIRTALASPGGLTRNWRVIIRAGTYFQSSELVFTLADKAGPGYAVVWEGYPGEHVVISGGESLSGFTVNGSGYWEKTVTAGYFGELWVNGNRSRWPIRPSNTAAPYTVSGTLSSTGSAATDPVKPTTPGDTCIGTNRFTFNAGELDSTWPGITDVRIQAWDTAWWHSLLKVTSVDNGTRTAVLNGRPLHTVGLTAGKPWRRENYVGDLSTSFKGEHYLNRTTRLLTYVPRDRETTGSSTVIRPKLSRLMVITNGGGRTENSGNTSQVSPLKAGNIGFINLTFSHTNSVLLDVGFIGSQGNQFYRHQGDICITGSENVTFDHCTFEHLGGTAVRFGPGCKYGSVVNCIFRDLGGSAVAAGWEMNNDSTIWPVGDFTSQKTTGWHTIRNNEIHDYGIVDPACPGVTLGGNLHTTIRNNRIYNGPAVGINVGFVFGATSFEVNRTQDILVAYNKIHDIGSSTYGPYDLGGVYTNGPVTNGVWEYNHIYNVVGYANTPDTEARGIYFDNYSVGKTARFNLVHDTSEASFQITYGIGNTVTNNIFVGSNYRHLATMTNPTENPSNLEVVNFNRNIVYWSHGQTRVNYPGGITSYRFTFDYNLYYASNQTITRFNNDQTVSQWTTIGNAGGPQDTHSIFNQDPLFTNVATKDFSLSPVSPAYSLGFQRFDVSSAGTQGPIGAT